MMTLTTTSNLCHVLVALRPMSCLRVALMTTTCSSLSGSHHPACSLVFENARIPRYLGLPLRLPDHDQPFFVSDLGVLAADHIHDHDTTIRTEMARVRRQAKKIISLWCGAWLGPASFVSEVCSAT